MDRLLYEYSVAHRGYLIIPYVSGAIETQSIYSYKLLSELGHRGKYHRADNPAQLHSASIDGIVMIAQDHLNEHSDIRKQDNDFKNRYTYRHNLIILYRQGDKCFYDHYPPQGLTNIAAPKIFRSETQCLNWIKQGLDRNGTSREQGVGGREE